MTCAAAHPFIEAVADGDAVPDAVRQHLDECPACRTQRALAQQIERALAGRPEPPVPDGFTLAVMARVRRERWRVEQAVDVGFNLVVASGALLILAGLAGLAWGAGVWDLGGELGARAVAAARTVGVGRSSTCRSSRPPCC